MSTETRAGHEAESESTECPEPELFESDLASEILQGDLFAELFDGHGATVENGGAMDGIATHLGDGVYATWTGDGMLLTANHRDPGQATDKIWMGMAELSNLATVIRSMTDKGDLK